MGLKMLGCALALNGYMEEITVCGQPMWQVTAFIRNSIVTVQMFWEAVWMSCVVKSTSQMQCKVYDSMSKEKPSQTSLACYLDQPYSCHLGYCFHAHCV